MQPNALRISCCVIPRCFTCSWRIESTLYFSERRPHSAHRYQPPATVRRVWLDSDNIDARLTA
ncbi:hypothetical protein FOZ70_01330 [Burkholderia sp. COPS]|nr:hypothetical protein [Burkholderia sp. COPS]